MLRRREPIVATAAAVLLAAGCGAGRSPGVANVSSSVPAGPTEPGPTGSSTATSQSTAADLAVRCPRRHGLRGFPDPTIATSGPGAREPGFDKRDFLRFPSAVVNDAEPTCRSALQRAGIGRPAPTATVTPRALKHLLDVARCMRRHGLASFPDPSSDGVFNFAGPASIRTPPLSSPS